MMMAGHLSKNRIPQARVVQGKHSPSWTAQPALNEPTRGTLTYARSTPAAENLVALLCGLWPLLAFTAMGIALLWSGTVYGTP
jgi:hypothetical protein